uniref:Protein MCM10 homolog n=1 Tax=Salmo trutta TaxID=8032 RepID=A0A673YA91_SALTR
MYTVNVSRMQISTKVCQHHTLSTLLFNSWQLSASNLIWVCFCVFSEELRRMQEQMQRLQQQLEASQKSSSATSTPNSIPGTKAPSKANTPSQGPPKQSSSKPVRPTQKTKPQAALSAVRQANPLPSLPKDVAIEKYSGLRLRSEHTHTHLPVTHTHSSTYNTHINTPRFLVRSSDLDSDWFVGFRRPRVSSTEMDRKMADRKLIRLSQLPERLAREKLEECDWVTFAVLVNKATPQSNSSGKTFSIWKLSDLHDLEVYVSLFLFGEVHKEHWKTEPGTVMGILNPNPMKAKDGYDGVSLSVDHHQKVLLMGEAQDYGTCKAAKKNGDPCSQIVNLYECQYCQYHVKAQYKKMSAQRAELQSSFSGKAAGKVKGRGNSLKERLCQTGFHYGGMSSPACAAALGLRLVLFLNVFDCFSAMKSNEVSGCSDDFKDLLSMPTPGALQLKRHLTKPPGSKGSVGAGVQSISASDLLKQQKQQQKQLLENRRRRAEEIQQRVLQNSGRAGVPGASPPSRGTLLSPKSASEVPKATQSPTAPHTPTLGRGFNEGDDILFFDHTPPPPPASHSLSALAALKKLRVKGAGLAKEDPNAVKRKRNSSTDITTRVQKNLSSPDGEQPGAKEEEPAQKKRREQMDYVQSEEFKKILNAKSRHGAELQAAEYQQQESYFDPLVKKEAMEDKMRNIREQKCRAVSCKKCKYTYFKPADRCVEEKHELQWHDATKRFFKCPCGQRAIALDRLPHKHCSNCGLFKWERDGMLKEKSGPKIAGELLQPRGDEQPKFLNSMQ